MLFNVKKCGVVAQATELATLAESPLLLQSDVVPIVESYQYLGFPFTANGLDCYAHIRNQHDVVSSFLRFVKFSSIGWSPHVRWIVFHTFIRPQMEYGAPLLNAFQRASVRKGFLKPLEIVQREALAWVLGCKPVHYQVNEMIFGVLPVSVRFQHLRTMFEVHKLSLQPDNPLILLLQQRRTMSMSSLLFHLRSDVLYSQFAATVVGVPVARQRAWLHSFLLSRRQDYLSNSELVLSKYITLSSRTKSLVDSVVFAPAAYQQAFLTWRRGSAFVGRKCLCGAMWKRSHLTHVLGYDDAVPVAIRRKFEAERHLFPTNYSIIDFLLNQREWTLCQLVFDVLRSVLTE
jgi:hypothetical protein